MGRHTSRELSHREAAAKWERELALSWLHFPKCVTWPGRSEGGEGGGDVSISRHMGIIEGNISRLLTMAQVNEAKERGGGGSARHFGNQHQLRQAVFFVSRQTPVRWQE